MEEQQATPVWWRRAGRPTVVALSLAVAVVVAIAVRHHPVAQTSGLVLAVAAILAWVVIDRVQHGFAVRAEENDVAAQRDQADRDWWRGTVRKPLASLSVRPAAADLLIGPDHRDPDGPMGQLATRLEELAGTRHGREQVLRLVLASALCALRDVSDYDGRFPSFRVQLLAGWPYDQPVELGVTSMPLGPEDQQRTRFVLLLGDEECFWEIWMSPGSRGTRVAARILPGVKSERPEA